MIGALRAHAGRGVGMRLLGELGAWTRAHCVSRLELTVRCDNKRANVRAWTRTF